MFSLVKVVGNSMLPTLSTGDFVLGVRCKTMRKLKKGDLVIVQHPSLGRIIKRIQLVSQNNFTLVGDNPLSASTHSMGTLEIRQVVAKVFLCITPAGIKLAKNSDANKLFA